jgi:hypothetical protein
MMTNNRIIIAGLLSWLLFIPGLIWSPFFYFLDFINAMGFTFGCAVLWRYLPGGFWTLLNAVRGRPVGRGAMLVLGIVQTWLAMIIRTGAIWQWRLLGEPDGGLDSTAMAIAAYLIIGGGACHLAASTMPEDHIQRPRLSAWLLWGALLAGLVLGTGIAFGRWFIA